MENISPQDTENIPQFDFQSSCDSYRRGLEKGLQNGRAVLAKVGILRILKIE